AALSRRSNPALTPASPASIARSMDSPPLQSIGRAHRNLNGPPDRVVRSVRLQTDRVARFSRTVWRSADLAKRRPSDLAPRRPNVAWKIAASGPPVLDRVD